MKGFHFPSTRTTNSVRLILGSQYSLCKSLNQTSPKHVLGTNLIPLRTKLVTQMKRVPAWPVINQLCFLERHFPANGISLSEVQMKFYERSLQALPFLCPSRLRRSLVRSRETRFARPNRRACSQANNNSVIYVLSM